MNSRYILYSYCFPEHFRSISFYFVVYSLYTRVCTVVTHPFASGPHRDNRKSHSLSCPDHTNNLSLLIRFQHILDYSICSMLAFSSSMPTQLRAWSMGFNPLFLRMLQRFIRFHVHCTFRKASMSVIHRLHIGQKGGNLKSPCSRRFYNQRWKHERLRCSLGAAKCKNIGEEFLMDDGCWLSVDTHPQTICAFEWLLSRRGALSERW